MSVRLAMTAVGVAALTALTAPQALATHDSGDVEILLRMSPDAKRLLVARCGVQGDEGELKVIDVTSGNVLVEEDLPQPDGEADRRSARTQGAQLRRGHRRPPTAGSSRSSSRPRTSRSQQCSRRR